MNVAEDQGQLEKAKAEQIIADTPLMDGVESISVELGEDHTGDPAMWLVFHLRPDLEADKQWHQRFYEYSRKIDRSIIDNGLQRFLYTRLRRAA
jgi:hypothetical protein